MDDSPPYRRLGDRHRWRLLEQPDPDPAAQGHDARAGMDPASGWRRHLQSPSAGQLFCFHETHRYGSTIYLHDPQHHLKVELNLARGKVVAEEAFERIDLYSITQTY